MTGGDGGQKQLQVQCASAICHACAVINQKLNNPFETSEKTPSPFDLPTFNSRKNKGLRLNQLVTLANCY